MHKVSKFWTKVLTVISFFAWIMIYPTIFFRKKSKKEKKMRVLVVPQLTRIGDIICSTPVFRAIKNKYPDSHLSVLVSAKASGIIKNDPNINELVIIENYQNNFYQLIKKIKKERFDFGISLSGTALSSVLFFYGLIPKRIKLTRNDRPLSEFLTDWMCNIKNNYSDLSYLPVFYLKMLKPLGIDTSEVKKEVFWSKDSEKRVSDFFEKNNIRSSDRVAGISLTAGNKVKEWGDDKFEAVAKEVVEKYKMKVLFIGGPGDRERVDKLIDKLGDGVNYINGAGLPLEDLPAQMNRLQIFVSVDTGPIHIAEALNKPLIDILGPVNDIELTPWGKSVRILKPTPDIPPTIFAFRKAGSEEMTQKALGSITVSQVKEAISSLLS